MCGSAGNSGRNFAGFPLFFGVHTQNVGFLLHGSELRAYIVWPVKENPNPRFARMEDTLAYEGSLDQKVSPYICADVLSKESDVEEIRRYGAM